MSSEHECLKVLNPKALVTLGVVLDGSLPAHNVRAGTVDRNCRGCVSSLTAYWQPRDVSWSLP